MRAEDLLCPTPAGLYSKAGGFHIDPTRPVERALITHGHSDHARAGHGAVLATRETLRIMAARYGEDFAGTTQAATLGEAMRIGDATVTFQPAGHVLGSAQIVVESNGLRIVASGDYKRRAGPDLPALRAGALRHLHHRGDLRPAGLSSPAGRRRDRQAARLAPAVPGACASRRRLFARQGAARDPHAPRPGLRPHHLPPRLDGPALPALRIRGRGARPARPGDGRDGQEGRLRRRRHHLPAVGDRRALGAALPRPGSRASRPAGCASASGRSRPMSSCR